MSRQLIGQVLNQMGKLTTIDIDEILVEQAMNHRRFGEIALSWGLCEIEQVAEAWCRQLAESDRTADLNEIAIDPSAAAALAPELARRLGAVPIRVLGNLVIVGTARKLDPTETGQISRAMGKDVRCVRIDPTQLKAALKTFYAAQAAA